MSTLTTDEPMVPPTAKRLKPLLPDQSDQTSPLQCPRCDSSNTKFCYYNNYSLTQPRYFCKSCRRYWTKGGTLRNIPIGGLSRKNKKLPSVTTTHHHRRRRDLQPQQTSHYNKLAISPDDNGIALNKTSAGLQLSQYPKSRVNLSENFEFMFEDLTIDFLDNGLGNRYYDCFPSVVTTGSVRGSGPFGETMSYYDGDNYEKLLNGDDVKPKLFDLEWRDQTGCYSDLHGSGVRRNGYLLGLGSSWTGSVNGYGSSSTNPLV